MPDNKVVPQFDFRILGPLEAAKNGRTIQLPAGRQRVVLAMLLLSANRIVSLEQLIDAVWEVDPPTTARVQVQICVSALRRSLHQPDRPDPILTRPPGYLLKVPVEKLDASFFEALVAEADRAAAADDTVGAVARLRTVLGLFRGHVLDGVPSNLVQAKATRLEERQMQVLERCVDLELGLDRHRALVGELGDLVSEHPLQERLRGFLMLALHRSGRTSEALDVYREGRRELIDELGLEPGAELRQLEKEILVEDEAVTQHETVDRVTRTPRQLPMDVADFTGRAEPLLVIDSLVTGDDTAAMPIGVISGKGGVGKSTLAVHAAHRLQATWFPDGQLYVDLRGTTDTPASPAAVLSRFLRSLGVPGSAVPEDLDERADLYRTVLADCKVLIVLDDAGDERQVLPLLPGSALCMVLVTSRNRLTGLPGACLVPLEEMDEQTALDLLARVAGSERVEAEREAAERLVDAVGGLPLALRVLGARLAARPHWSLSMMADRLLDERSRLDELAYGDLRVRASLALTIDPLPDEVRSLLRRLAGLDHSVFPEWLAAVVLDTTVHEALPVLEHLVDAQLVDYAGEDPAGNARYRCHELVRVYAKERLFAEESADDRAATARRVVGCWLALFDEAHRREYGGDFTRLTGSGDRWHLDQAYVAAMLSSPLNWMDHVRPEVLAAMRQAADHDLDELCWELTVSAVTLFESRCYFDDWQESHQQALELTRRSRNEHGEAVVLCSMGSLQITRQKVAESRTSLDRALELFERGDDVHGRAMALRNLATLDRMQGSLDDSMRRYNLAREGFRKADDPVGEAHVLCNTAQVQMLQGHFTEAEKQLRQSLDICRRVGSRRVEAQVMFHLGGVALHQRELDVAEQALRDVLTIVRSTGDPVGEWHALSTLGEVRGQLGDYQQATEHLYAAIDICEQTLDQMGEAQVQLSLARVLFSFDEHDDADQVARSALETFERYGSKPMMLAAEELLDRIRSAPGQPATG